MQDLTDANCLVGVDCSIEVAAALDDVWQAWTTTAGARSFFAPVTNIRLALGGEYEIQFHPTDERHGTKGLKILSYAPKSMLSFQWNAPPHMPSVRDGNTWVVVELAELSSDQTRVRLRHLGWQGGPEWDEARIHFRRGWSGALARLSRRFTQGPIDWAREPMMWQEHRPAVDAS